MSEAKSESPGLCADMLYTMLERRTDTTPMSDEQVAETRTAVNEFLDQLGNDFLNETLRQLYRIAEVDARQRRLRRALLLDGPNRATDARICLKGTR